MGLLGSIGGIVGGLLGGGGGGNSASQSTKTEVNNTNNIDIANTIDTTGLGQALAYQADLWSSTMQQSQQLFSEQADALKSFLTSLFSSQSEQIDEQAKKQLTLALLTAQGEQQQAQALDSRLEKIGKGAGIIASLGLLIWMFKK